MAYRAQQLTPATLAGVGVAAGLFCLCAGTLGVVALWAQGPVELKSADFAAIRFTVTQAVISAILSAALAIPLARALARHRFPGRALMVTLLGAPFILPVIVAVLGLLAVYGRGGIVSQALEPLGLGPLNIYGLPGVVLAHVFFNLPLATRLILLGWHAIPAEHFRLAAQLGMGPREVARWLERPMLRSVLPGVLATVFLLCIASFAVALTLGGGPRATTVELAIYQAFRFDFDLGKAATLALVQFVLSLAAAMAAWRFARPGGFGTGLDTPIRRWDRQTGAGLAGDVAILFFSAAFVLLPLVMILWRGVVPMLSLPMVVYLAALRSVLVALASAGLALAMGLCLSLAIARLENRRRLGAGVLESAGYLSIAASPMVIGTGLFIVVFPLVDPARVALPLITLVNALMSLPFLLRVLIPAVREVETGYGRLSSGLGIHGTSHFRLILWPRIRPAAGFATGLAAALSMGDLGVVALFAEPDRATLPLMIYRLMGAYRMDMANGAALLLVIVSVLMFRFFERSGRRDA